MVSAKSFLTRTGVKTDIDLEFCPYPILQHCSKRDGPRILKKNLNRTHITRLLVFQRQDLYGNYVSCVLHESDFLNLQLTSFLGLEWYSPPVWVTLGHVYIDWVMAASPRANTCRKYSIQQNYFKSSQFLYWRRLYGGRLNKVIKSS